MTKDEKYMQRCNDLALLGKGYVAPNPMVGSVAVYNDKIIGEGYHQSYGNAHAEVNAINSVKDKSLLEKATIYINLEPCAHFGKTPPCADLIIASKIPNVVIGCVDSYSEVAGKGIERLKNAGANVTVGVLEEECLDLNRRFFTFHNKNRPYIILKWAQSSNGFMDIDRSTDKKGIFWITQPETKALVHKWRHEEAGILVGKNTVKTDNPSLTCRDFKGLSPTRFIIDQRMRLDYDGFAVGNRKVPTFVLTEKKVVSSGSLQFVTPDDFSISGILKKIHDLDVQSLLIEGGATTLNHFIESNLWDEARIISGTENIAKGQKAPYINGNRAESFSFGKDHIKILTND